MKYNLQLTSFIHNKHIKYHKLIRLLISSHPYHQSTDFCNRNVGRIVTDLQRTVNNYRFHTLLTDGALKQVVLASLYLTLSP